MGVFFILFFFVVVVVSLFWILFGLFWALFGFLNSVMKTIIFVFGVKPWKHE